MLEGSDVRAAAARLPSGRKRPPCPGPRGAEAAGREGRDGGEGGRPPLAFCPPRGRATGGAEPREAAAEMAAATWEPAEEKEGQGFPSGPPARGGEGRMEGGSPREAPPAPAERRLRVSRGRGAPPSPRRLPARSPRGHPSVWGRGRRAACAPSSGEFFHSYLPYDRRRDFYF